MINLLLALAAAVVATLLTHLKFGWLASTMPGSLAFLGAYFLLAKRTGAQVQARVEMAQAFLTAPVRTEKEKNAALDKAIEIFKSAAELGKWQFFIAGELGANIGVLQYMKHDHAAAKPY